MKSILKLVQFIFMICLVGLCFFFFWENAQPVQVQFLNWMSPSHPLATSLLLSFCIGFLVAGFYFILEHIRSGSKLRGANKTIKKLQKEIDDLRNNPLAEKVREDTLTSRSWVNDLEQSASIQTQDKKEDVALNKDTEKTLAEPRN